MIGSGLWTDGRTDGRTHRDTHTDVQTVSHRERLLFGDCITLKVRLIDSDLMTSMAPRRSSGRRRLMVSRREMEVEELESVG